MCQRNKILFGTTVIFSFFFLIKNFPLRQNPAFISGQTGNAIVGDNKVSVEVHHGKPDIQTIRLGDRRTLS